MVLLKADLMVDEKAVMSVDSTDSMLESHMVDEMVEKKVLQMVDVSVEKMVVKLAAMWVDLLESA
jgi:hypothetical protein